MIKTIITKLCAFALTAISNTDEPLQSGIKAGGEFTDKASEAINTLLTLIILIILLPIAYIVARKIFSRMPGGKQKGILEETKDRAEKLEKNGDYIGSAEAFEEIHDLENALRLYIKGKDYARAGAIYEALQKYEQAIDMYKRSGETDRIATVYMKTKNFIEAAKIFKNKGDRVRAAQALEMFGNKVAAAREYEEGKQFIKAAKLYKDERLYREAAWAYLKSLEGTDVNKDNLDRYYTYAAFLVLSGDMENAEIVYKRMMSVDPDYKDVWEKLISISRKYRAPVPEAAKPEEKPEAIAAPLPKEDIKPATVIAPASAKESAREIVGKEIDELDAALDKEAKAGGLRSEVPLRSIISSGGIEPKYAMRMWVQILKTLAEKHKTGYAYGFLSPDSIFIDMENNVRISGDGLKGTDYADPETKAGKALDARSDVYSMGLMLYAMIAGTVEGAGKKALSGSNAEVPAWLDALVMKSVNADRAGRFQSLDEIFGALVELKNK